jgi:hypothetical protein
MKTLEYLAAGTPVIITHAEGVSDIVEKASCGLVIPPDDPRALADTILLLTKQPDMRQQMGKLGRELVMAGYTWQHTVRSMLNFINQRTTPSCR